MASTIIGNWRLILNSLAVGAVVGFTALFLGATTHREDQGKEYFPSMTMVYEANGPSVNGIQTSEVHRLEYRSRTDWTDTVIEARGVEVRTGNFQGVFNNIGSYSQQKGSEYTEYHVFTDSHHRNIEEPNTTILPHGALRPYSLDVLLRHRGIELVPTTTSTTVCYMDGCQENAPGLLYISENGREEVFVEDRRWDIPLRIGGSFFLVRELRIEDQRP